MSRKIQILLVLIALLSSPKSFGIDELLHPPQTFWKRLWCGDLTSSVQTRTKQFEGRISTLKSATSGYFDMKEWKLVQQETLTQYLETVDQAINAAIRLARISGTEEGVQLFRQNWSQIYRYSISVEEFGAGVDYVIARRSGQAGFDPKTVLRLKDDYWLRKDILENFSISKTPLSVDRYVDVNEVAFQNELANIQSTIGWDLRFRGLVKGSDGNERQNPFAAKIRDLSRKSIPPKEDFLVEDAAKVQAWKITRAEEWNRQLTAQISNQSDSSRAVLQALQALNYEALKYMYMGYLTPTARELNLYTLSSFLDSLLTAVKGAKLNQTPEFLEARKIAENFSKGLEGFWAYEAYKATQYRERLQALSRQLNKQSL